MRRCLESRPIGRKASFRTSDEPPEFEWIEQHRAATTASLARFRANPAVRAKYEWVARYHNFWCDTRHLEGYLIECFSALEAQLLDAIEDF